MNKNFDVIIIGAGSVGLPAACAIAGDNLKVLVVDQLSCPGQGQQKAAIGGIRATHSNLGKIRACSRSLQIYSQWREKYGDDIGWQKGGYLYPAYGESFEKDIKKLLIFQKKHGMNIDWISPDDIGALVPGINQDQLLGGTFSPDDGSASPLLATSAFYRLALARKAQFLFNSTVIGFSVNNDKIQGIRTDKGDFNSPIIINAAGANGGEIAKMAGLDLPIVPDSHEAGITEPVSRIFHAMVVDMRPTENSKNFYFYQNEQGQIVFCLTPSPLIVGKDRRSTSQFLPLACQRMIQLIPRLRNIKVRRIWRGLYPMSPDGSPLVGKSGDIEGFYFALGMCGQGFMLGPGIGEYLSRIISGNLREMDKEISHSFDPYRDFSGSDEALL